ncbi:hypothetical protein BJ742DRAFT_526487 [Cladochytrium replicatum]|nr:hypothetical protein BJ742DRAFT_526487 [Cladochytrium replicatum]
MSDLMLESDDDDHLYPMMALPPAPEETRLSYGNDRDTRMGNAGVEPDEDDDEEADQQEDEDDDFGNGIPSFVGAAMDAAAASIGGKTNKYSQLLWEDDEAAIMELEETGYEGLLNSAPTRGRRKAGGSGTQPGRRGRRRRRGPTAESTLPPDLAKALGDANMAYSRADYQEAIRLLHEVIRGAPTTYQAWLTLAMVHDELGEPRKSLECLFIAAHLKERDRDLWRRLAEIARRLNDVNQVIYCLRKAIQSDPTDLDSLWERAKLLLDQQKTYQAIRCYHKMLQIIPNNMFVVKALSKIYLGRMDYDSAIALYQGALEADAFDPLPLPGTVAPSKGNRPATDDDEFIDSEEDYDEDFDDLEEEDYDDNDDDAEPDPDVVGFTTALRQSQGLKRPNRRRRGARSNHGVEVIGLMSMGMSIARPVRVGYEELLLLANLYSEKGMYQQIVRCIHDAARRMTNKPPLVVPPQQAPLMVPTLTEEGWILAPAQTASGSTVTDWVPPDDDGLDDPDEATQMQMDDLAVYMIPVEVRVKLGCARLSIGEAEPAMKQFGYLYRVPIGLQHELYFEVGESYLNVGMHREALGIFKALTENEESNTPQTWGKMAYCYQQMNDLEAAVELYLSVIEAMPENTDAKFSLAEIYEELGEDEKAHQLAREIDEITRNFPAQQTGQSNDERSRKDDAVKAAEEALQIKANLLLLEKVRNLQDRVNKDKLGRTDYIRTTRLLLSRFQSSKALYPSRRREYKVRKKAAKMTLNEVYQEIGEVLGKEGSAVTSFQGIAFTEWFDLFVQCAIALVKDGRPEEAHGLLKSACDANVFYYDNRRKVQLRLLMISIAMQADDWMSVGHHCRWIVTHRPTFNVVYRIYNTAMAGGAGAITAFGCRTAEKFHKRYVKYMDQALKKRGPPPALPSSSRSANPDEAFINATSDLWTEHNPLLLTNYAHIFSVGRTFVKAIEMYTRAYQLCPQDPVLLLSLGVSYLHRAMQRKSENRHLHVVQGMTLIHRYEEAMTGTLESAGQVVTRDLNALLRKREAYYNLARAYHMIGLNHLACQYYEKLLRDEEWGTVTATIQEYSGAVPPLQREGAYNYSLLHIASGNPAMALYLLQKFCKL